jgi:hemerythrin
VNQDHQKRQERIKNESQSEQHKKLFRIMNQTILLIYRALHHCNDQAKDKILQNGYTRSID